MDRTKVKYECQEAYLVDLLNALDKNNKNDVKELLSKTIIPDQLTQQLLAQSKSLQGG